MTANGPVGPVGPSGVAVPLSAAESGSIYDIGYRSYEGPRLGRAHAVRSLYLHSLRSAFGIGRGGRAKMAPLVLGIISVIPAVAIIAAQALFRQFPGGGALEAELPIRYDTYAGTIGIFIILFCAAQAPDLFGRDQRHALLSLYFARALRREDYALARVGGFMTAVFILQLLPQVVLFLGQVLLATDVVKGFTDDLPEMAAVVAQGALTAALLGGISMAIAAFTPRRAYAVAGIIAVFLIPSIVIGIIIGIGALDIGPWLALASPTSILEGTNAFLFDTPRIVGGERTTVPDLAFFGAAAVGVAGSLALTVRRFQGITA
jgi:ABC-2 type transport system permease protein